MTSNPKLQEEVSVYEHFKFIYKNDKEKLRFMTQYEKAVLNYNKYKLFH